MNLFDYTTMPVEGSFTWDPNSIVGKSLMNETWIGYTEQERLAWLAELNSGSNDDTFVSKMIEWECFLTIIIRGGNYRYKFIVLDNFQRFIEGPVFDGPHNWPDQN